MADPTLTPWRGLGCAILVRAAKDARGRNGTGTDARAFLQSDGARWLWTCLDLDAGRLDRLIDELPAAPGEQLPLW